MTASYSMNSGVFEAEIRQWMRSIEGQIDELRPAEPDESNEPEAVEPMSELEFRDNIIAQLQENLLFHVAAFEEAAHLVAEFINRDEVECDGCPSFVQDICAESDVDTLCGLDITDVNERIIEGIRKLILRNRSNDEEERSSIDES